MAIFGKRTSGSAGRDSSGRYDVTHPGSSPAQKRDAADSLARARAAMMGGSTPPLPPMPGKPSVVKISSDGPAPRPPSDTRAARKANSPKAKEKALKSINKNPLTPDDTPWSKSGFKQSEAASDYDSARYSEQRLAKDEYPSLMHTSAKEFKESDEDTVGSYIATGKNRFSDEGQDWIAKKGSGAKKKRDEEYG